MREIDILTNITISVDKILRSESEEQYKERLQKLEEISYFYRSIGYAKENSALDNRRHASISILNNRETKIFLSTNFHLYYKMGDSIAICDDACNVTAVTSNGVIEAVTRLISYEEWKKQYENQKHKFRPLKFGL